MTSWRTQSAVASIAPAKPLAGRPRACARAIARALSTKISVQSTADTSMKTTCLVGERLSVSGPRWMSGQRGRWMVPMG